MRNCCHATAALVLLVGLTGCATAPPRGSLWTVQCMELSGPHRVAQAEALAETLRHTPGARPAEVMVHEGSDGVARLYYGAYARTRDPRSGEPQFPEAMRRDIDWLRQLGDETGRRYFVRALPVRMPLPDVGKPEWNLARLSGLFSLQVAVFEPTDEFGDYKRAAAEFCAFLRGKGYEAYYYHANASSMVTVGVFGPDAVEIDRMGRTNYSAQVRAMQRDELLAHNLVNGGIVKVKNDDGVMVPVPSALVRIPQPQESSSP